MRRREGFGKTTAWIVATALLAGLAAPTADAAADPVAKCRQALLRGAAAVARSRLAALAKCEAAKRAGTLAEATPCRDQPKVAAADAKAARKLAAGVARACGGADKRCGGADDLPLAALGWPSACPELEGSGCAVPLVSCADAGACVACLADAAVARGVALAYAPFAVADAETQKAVVRCQKALAKAATALTSARLAADARCLAARLAGKHAAPCPVPGDGKTAAALAKARAKAEAAVCKACGGPDRRCGGGDDLAREVVGTASACPAVGSCDPAIAGFADLVACFECAAAARADCALLGAAPSVASYPPACAVVPPTPTPTRTPTPTPTPTPRFCPRDLARAAIVTIGLDADVPPGVGGASLMLAYDPEQLRLDGAGDDAAVRNAVTDLTNGKLLGKGSPNNQDADGDGTPERLRLTLVSQDGVGGPVLAVAFGVCVDAAEPVAADFACTLVGTPVAPDGVTKLPATTCTLGVGAAGP